MRLWLLAIAFALLSISNGVAGDAPPGPGSSSPGDTLVGVYDPTGQRPRQIQWPAYPATPPAGFHWQKTGSPAVKLDPATGQPAPGQFNDTWILVRDGYSMPKMLMMR